MDEQKVIINFLTEAGFTKRGQNQYTKKDVGTIFIRQWDVSVVLNQILELGEKHHAKRLRDLLKIQDAVEVYIFNPTV